MHADARNLLWDARQAAERVVRFTHGKTFGDYQTDELLRSAVERQLEIVGEGLNGGISAPLSTRSRPCLRNRERQA